MEVKKNKSADLRRYRMLFFQIGLIFSLSLALWIFNLSRDGDFRPFDHSFIHPEDDDIMQIASLKIIPDKKLINIKRNSPLQEDQAIIELPDEGDASKLNDSRNDVSAPFSDDQAWLEDPSEDDLEYTGEALHIGEVSEVASFIGGMDAMYRFIQEELKYPGEAKKEGIGGRVVVSFIVEQDGSISQIEIIQCNPAGYGFEREARKLVQKMSGKWQAALQGDRKVRMWFQLPIAFQMY